MIVFPTMGTWVNELLYCLHCVPVLKNICVCAVGAWGIQLLCCM